MLTDQVRAMREIVEALLHMSGRLGESMYYDDDHRYADANDEFTESYKALRMASQHLAETITKMEETDR